MLEFAVGFGGGRLALNLWIQLVLQVAFLIGALGLATVWAGMWVCMLNFERETLAGSVYLPVFVLLAAGCHYAAVFEYAVLARA